MDVRLPLALLANLAAFAFAMCLLDATRNPSTVTFVVAAVAFMAWVYSARSLLNLEHA